MTYYEEDVDRIKKELVKIADEYDLTDSEAVELLEDVKDEIELGDWSVEEGVTESE
jgi:hypothetical protein